MTGRSIKIKDGPGHMFIDLV